MWKFILFTLSIGALVACDMKSKSRQADSDPGLSVVEIEETAAVVQEEVAWNAILSESEIWWRGFKPGGEHEGTVDLDSGTLVFSENNVKGIFMVNMKSIHVKDLEGNMKAKLEDHLLGEDFFDVNKYPMAVFEVTGMEPSENKDYPVHLYGNLSIKDSTHTINFLMKYALMNDTLMAESDRFEIDRTAFGVDYMSKNVFKELKDKFIDDKISLKLKMKFVQ